MAETRNNDSTHPPRTIAALMVNFLRLPCDGAVSRRSCGSFDICYKILKYVTILAQADIAERMRKTAAAFFRERDCHGTSVPTRPFAAVWFHLPFHIERLEEAFIGTRTSARSPIRTGQGTSPCAISTRQIATQRPHGLAARQEHGDFPDPDHLPLPPPAATKLVTPAPLTVPVWPVYDGPALALRSICQQGQNPVFRDHPCPPHPRPARRRTCHGSAAAVPALPGL